MRMAVEKGHHSFCTCRPDHASCTMSCALDRHNTADKISCMLKTAYAIEIVSSQYALGWVHRFIGIWRACFAHTKGASYNNAGAHNNYAHPYGRAGRASWFWLHCKSSTKGFDPKKKMVCAVEQLHVFERMTDCMLNACRRWPFLSRAFSTTYHRQVNAVFAWMFHTRTSQRLLISSDASLWATLLQ